MPRDALFFSYTKLPMFKNPLLKFLDLPLFNGHGFAGMVCSELGKPQRAGQSCSSRGSDLSARRVHEGPKLDLWMSLVLLLNFMLYKSPPTSPTHHPYHHHL